MTIKIHNDRKNPIDFGYNTSTWTGALLIDWIKNEYGVEYKKTQIYNLLHALGLSHQKTKGNYPEADKLDKNNLRTL